MGRKKYPNFLFFLESGIVGNQILSPPPGGFLLFRRALDQHTRASRIAFLLGSVLELRVLYILSTRVVCQKHREPFYQSLYYLHNIYYHYIIINKFIMSSHHIKLLRLKTKIPFKSQLFLWQVIFPGSQIIFTSPDDHLD